MAQRTAGYDAWPRWPAVATVGFGLTLGLALGAPVLARGGLAPIALATLVAAFVGIPLATTEWTAARDHAPDDPWDRAAYSIGELWTALLLGALAAPRVAEHGLSGLAIVGCAWVVIAVCSRASRLAVPVIALFAVVATLTSGGIAASTAAPWTLLEPHWDTWRAWVPVAVAGGVLLPAAGFGQWRAAREPVPGMRNLPWAVAGVGLLAALAMALSSGAAWELAPSGVELPLIELAWMSGFTAALCAVLSRPGPRRRAAVQVAAGVAATAWFAWPAADTLALWWSSLLPLGPAFVALVLARRSAARWTCGVAGAALLAASAVGWPGLPADASAAAAFALVPVFAVWWAGTRALVWSPT